MGKLYVPQDGTIQRDIVAACHDTLLTGHPGELGTLELVRCHYWWPGMACFVKQYVQSCHTCQRAKSTRQSMRAPLQPHDVPTEPWEVWSTDHIAELPKSNGYNAIIVVQDYSTKMAHFNPCTMRMTTKDKANIHINHVFHLHGLPFKIVSD